jgi:hypothetical protein
VPVGAQVSQTEGRTFRQAQGCSRARRRGSVEVASSAYVEQQQRLPRSAQLVEEGDTAKGGGALKGCALDLRPPGLDRFAPPNTGTSAVAYSHFGVVQRP